ncbi:MAG: EpsI family protein [Armatimonadota bacterium]|nr:EpsI family protein [Armatimonadota bacterium]MDR7443505.1 EpsI family protein [Armatimonadota bacterium]MDR7569344.1 EpsI family protein [Armatimonadota bacterium]MDR7615004.1 EpsI family protein [Armatimonadota bacterium]
MSGPKLFAALASLFLAAVTVQATLGHAVPLRVSLTEFPRSIGPWVGSDEPLDPEALSRARPDAYLSRRYTDPRGPSVLLYVAYFARDSSRARIQAACWGDCQVRQTATHRVEIGGRTLAVNRALVVQEGEPAVILYWFQLGQRILQDPDQLRLSQVRRALLGRRSDGALVRISSPVRSDPEEALSRAEAFLRAVLPGLLRHLPE